MRQTQLPSPNKGPNAQALVQVQTQGQAQLQNGVRAVNPGNNQQNYPNNQGNQGNSNNVTNASGNINNMNNRNLTQQHQQLGNNQHNGQGQGQGQAQQVNNGANRNLAIANPQKFKTNHFASAPAPLVRTGGGSTPSSGSPMLLSHNPGTNPNTNTVGNNKPTPASGVYSNNPVLTQNVAQNGNVSGPDLTTRNPNPNLIKMATQTLILILVLVLVLSPRCNLATY